MEIAGEPRGMCTVKTLPCPTSLLTETAPVMRAHELVHDRQSDALAR